MLTEEQALHIVKVVANAGVGALCPIYWQAVVESSPVKVPVLENWQANTAYGAMIGGLDHSTPVTTTGANTWANATSGPFMGSGTTLRAAKDLGRKANGWANYWRSQIAAKRMAQEVLALRSSNG